MADKDTAINSEQFKTKLFTEITGRQTFLESDRLRFDAITEHVGSHIHPVREDIKQTKLQGERQGVQIYDGTGQNALNTFANGLYGNMVSPAINWFRLGVGDEKVMENATVRQWVQEVERHLYSVFNASNFYDAVFPWIKDGAGMGTATMFPSEDIERGGVHFLTIHPGQVYISLNNRMEVDVLHRKFKMSAKQMAQEFGEDVLPQSVKNALVNNQFEIFEIIHAVYPNESYDPLSIAARRQKFSSVWLVSDANANEAILRMSGFRRFPYVVWLYEQSGQENYGRCPGMYALADMMGLNLMSKLLLGAAEKAVDPPVSLPDEMSDEEYNGMPRGLNWYTQPDRIPIVQDSRAQFPITLEIQQDKRDAINRHFHVDFFLMLQSAERGLTATEVLERQGEKASVLGAAIGRMSRSLDRIIDAVFDIEFEAGRLPPIPQALLDSKVERVDPVYMGPLAQIQRRLFQTTGIMRSLESMQIPFTLKPETMDTIKWDDLTIELAEIGGMPQKLIMDKNTLQLLRAQRGAQEQQAAELDKLAEGSKATKDLAQADQLTGGQISAVGEELAGAG